MRQPLTARTCAWWAMVLALSWVSFGCGGTGTLPPLDDVQDDTTTPVDDPLSDDTTAVDSDGDGFSDDDEINAIPGTDPLDPTDNANNVHDADGDGCSDFDELNFAGFCDNDPNSTDGTVIAPPGGNVSVSGNLLIGSSAVVDGDTNDATNPVIPNNAETLTQVQTIPNPCALGGYLGTVATGTDVTDAYIVQLAANQTASLLLADPTVNDFDLYLYDEAGNPVDSSEGIGKAEQVTAPTGGTFIVTVDAYSVVFGGDTGGLYTLLVGENAFAGSLTAGNHLAVDNHLSSLHPFVEGEVVLEYKTQVARFQQATDDGIDYDVLNPAAQSGGVERLRVKSIRRVGGRTGAKSVATSVLKRPVSDTIAAIKALRRRPDVAYAEPNYHRRALATPNDEYYQLQWHYPQIGLPDAWDITTGDPNVIVAVIDTGVVLAHPDLAGQLVDGYDFISDPLSALDGDGIDANPNDPGDQGIQGTTSTFHGTHVSGTIAARTDNGSGVAGVAWNARIMPIRVLGQGGGTEFDIVQGIRYAAGLSNSSGTLPDRPADIINMSLGGQGLSTAEQEAVNAARAAGVIVIAAAGNESSNANYSSPAGLAGVVTVSAVGFTRDAAPYTNFGSSVDLAAPGGDSSVDANGDTWADGVLSSMAKDDGSFTYDFSQGTSMAAPHVAGVAALMKSVNPAMTVNDFDLLVAGNHPGTTIAITDDLGTAGKDDYFGYGLINALSAVRAAGEISGANAIDTPLIQIVPIDVDLGSSLSSSNVTVRNVGVGDLSVTSVTTDADWLTVSPTSGAEGTYTVSAARGGLDDGVYSGTVTFASNGGSASVSTRMRVGTPTVGGGTIGTVYVLLLDTEVFATVAQDNVVSSNGYAFDFTDIPPGTYGLVAGTDLDNDSFIDNEGEALGVYPTLLDPLDLELYQDRSGLSFNVNYLINIQTPGAASVSPVTRPAPQWQRIRKTPIR